MKKVNWGMLATVTALYAVVTVFAVHISRQLRYLNETIQSLAEEYDICDEN